MPCPLSFFFGSGDAHILSTNALCSPPLYPRSPQVLRVQRLVYKVETAFSNLDAARARPPPVASFTQSTSSGGSRSGLSRRESSGGSISGAVSGTASDGGGVSSAKRPRYRFDRDEDDRDLDALVNGSGGGGGGRGGGGGKRSRSNEAFASARAVRS